MPGGQPTTFTQDIADTLCSELAAGVSLRTACKAEGMPCVKTVFNWFRVNDQFLQQYTRAKEESADAWIEDILDIADDGTNDWMEVEGKDGENTGWKLNGEHVQRSKLRIDTRKWAASKLKPKKYGDKLDVNASGNITVEIVRFADKTPE